MYRKYFQEIIFLAICLTMSLGQEETLCRGQKLIMNAEQKMVIADCLNEVGIASVMKIPLDKYACFGQCVFAKKGFLTADGKIDHDILLAYVDKVMKPDEVKKPMVDGIEKCLKEHGDKAKSNDDPTCKTFLEVGSCIQTVFLEICVTS